MTSITTRAGKGTPLTHTEVDDNFTNLNADKLEVSNNLSDVSSASAARTNLGLGTAATTASTDYATAAQGALADSAVQPNDSPTFDGLTVDGKIATGDELGNANLSNTLDYASAGGVTGYRPINLIDSLAGIKISRPNDEGDGAFIEFQEWDSTITTLNSRAMIVGEGGDFIYRNLTTGGGDHIFQGEANAELMRIDSDGQVGIGTDSPSDLLDLSSSDPRIRLTNTGSGYCLVRTGGSDASLILDADAGNTGSGSDIIMRVDGSEKMRIASSGNVGIGTSSPSEQLSVLANVSATNFYVTSGGDTSASGISGGFKHNGINSKSLVIEADPNNVGSNTAMSFEVDGSEAMRIDASGNVGIGTTNLNYRLAVKDAGVDLALINQNDTVWTVGQNVVLDEFSIRDASQGATRLHIDSSGNLGIGTTSPQEKLHVIGSAKLDFGSGGGNPRLYFDHDTVTDDANYIQLNRGDAGLEIISEDNLKFDTNGSERMRIDSSGDVKINANNGTSDTRELTVESEGYAVIKINGDISNTSGEVGGAALQLDVDGIGTPNGVVSFVQTADDSGYGTTYTGTVGNSMLVGTTANAAIIFGINNVAKLRLGNNQFFPITDNAFDLGSSSNRYDDIFATNGTIQTSDRDEKQDIEALSDAEQRVAVACKGLLRKFRWKDAVAEKGDDARIHFGIIAQDLQDAFAAEGLDAGRYAMFISSTWWEATETYTDDDGVEQTRVNAYEAAEEAPEGATERTRLGVRYPELLAFIIAAI